MLTTETQRIKEWLAKQPFGRSQQCWEPLTGAIEELGELCRANLKGHQGIRGTAEYHSTKAQDSVGDCVIYLLGFCIASSIDVNDCQVVHGFSDTYHRPHNCLLMAAAAIGRLAGEWAFGHPAELALSRQYVGEAISWLIHYCKTSGYSFEGCVSMAMAEVMARDWALNPETGVVAQPAQEASAHE